MREGGGAGRTRTVRHEEYHQRGVRSQDGAFEKLFGVEEHVLQPRRVEFRVRDTLAIADVLVQKADGQHRQRGVEHVVHGYVERVENRLERNDQFTSSARGKRDCRGKRCHRHVCFRKHSFRPCRFGVSR